MSATPTIERPGRIQEALDAFSGEQTPTYQVTLPHLPWQKRLRRWAVRKAIRIVTRTMRKMWGWKRSLAPWWIAMVVWVAAALSSFAQRGWVTMLSVGMVGLPVLWWWLGAPLGRWTRRRKLKPREQRAWVAAFYAFLMGWAAVASATTVLAPMSGWLWTMTFVVWVRWMWHHRARPEELQMLTDREERWLKLAGPGKPLADAVLQDLVEYDQPKRWEADIVLPSGEKTVGDVLSNHRRICSAFSARRDNVIIDEGPGGVEDLARLSVILENPCHQPILFDESWHQEFAEGCFPFHVYPDGSRGGFRLWQPMSGTVCALFSGDTRSGKSAGMESGLVQACLTGLVWPLIADPQGGQSMPAWVGEQGHGKWKSTDAEGVLFQLLAIREVMYDRSRRLQRMTWRDDDGEEIFGIGFYDPAVTGLPILLFVIDEAHMAAKDPVFGPMIVELIDEIVKMCGKTGIALWLATQYPGIEELGNKMSLRQQLLAGNVVCYRNSATTAGQMVLPSHMPRPHEIPKETPEGDHTKGTAVIYSAAPRSSRATYARSVWTKRAHRMAAVAAARIPNLLEVDPESWVILQKWMLAQELGYENLKKREAEGGQSTDQAGVATPAVPTQGAKKGKVIDRIIAFLQGREGGRAHTGVIAEAIGSPLSTVSQTLSRAQSSGKVHQVRVGVWALGREPEAATEIVAEEAAA